MSSSPSRRFIATGATALVLCIPVLGGLVTTTTPAVASGPATGAKYVALGDAYSSGEGLGRYQAGTAVARGANKNTCHRSRTHAYSDLSHRVVLPGVKRRSFWACSGATVKDIEHTPGTHGTPKQHGQPSQFATIGSTTQYITLTVGADDVGLDTVARACLSGRVHNQAVHLSSRSCAKQVRVSESRLTRLRTRLVGLYSKVLDASSPSSELVVAGYPRIFPRSFRRAGVLNGAPFCTFDRSHLGTVGMTVMNAMLVASFEQKLNKAIRKAIARAARTQPGRIMYANVYRKSVPLSCQGKTRWDTIAGLDLAPSGHGIGPGKLISPTTLHPTRAGQRVYARTIEAVFRAFARLRRTIHFVGTPGTSAPPARLGPYITQPLPFESRTIGRHVSTIRTKAGNIRLTAAGEIDGIGNGWESWSNGYAGDVYFFAANGAHGRTSVTLKLPKGTKALYFYAEPQLYETLSLRASANNGTSSGDKTITGSAGATYFGFYASRGHTIRTITVRSVGEFALGEFGIAH
jgi:hypothetical protein